MAEFLNTWLQMMCCMTAGDALVAGLAVGGTLVLVIALCRGVYVLVRRRIRKARRHRRGLQAEVERHG